MMQRLKFMYRFFLMQPIWFKILAPAALILSILFSSSLFGEDAGYEGGAKLAAAVFFGLWGLQFRRNRRLAIIFFALAAFSLYLAVNAFLKEG
ncbi:hypothetical protein OMP38_31580 [Cohnella ginsengisoli]|uniref:Uncharacterized protein n=1 Tax=Cohnella ginsengisoli TaxID=425004 RepID=A0A9X4KMR1_9BACL|nr:hypothetical protein [Cohnella ginsengisoli]MDG0794863.1 hypothetical protein [Cohnella ginsengisoli]